MSGFSVNNDGASRACLSNLFEKRAGGQHNRGYQGSILDNIYYIGRPAACQTAWASPGFKPAGAVSADAVAGGVDYRRTAGSAEIALLYLSGGLF